MNVQKTAQGYFLRLTTGEEVIGTLTQFAKQNDIRMASLTLLGAASHLELGYYTLSEKQYHWKEFSGEFEILAGVGNLSMFQGEPMLHLHGTFSGTDFAALGGHVRRAIVGASCEVMITTHDGAIERSFDEASGLNLWDCK